MPGSQLRTNLPEVERKQTHMHLQTLIYDKPAGWQNLQAGGVEGVIGRGRGCEESGVIMIYLVLYLTGEELIWGTFPQFEVLFFTQRSR
jgi:hypothetical protein